MELFTESAEQTQEVGKKLATSLIEGKKTKFTASLVGELGSGKTTFVQGFARGLGIRERIISPTFILMRKYEIRSKPRGLLDFYHVDLYRLEENPHEEILNLGLTDIWGKEGNVVLVEWGEKIKDLFPKDSFLIEFKNLGEERRKITVKENP